MRSEHRCGFGDRIAHRSFGKGGSTTTTEKFRHRLPSRRALCARIASGLRRTHGGGGAGWPTCGMRGAEEIPVARLGGARDPPVACRGDVILIRRHHFALAAPVIVVGLFISPIADLALAAIAEAGRTSQWRGFLTSHELPRVLLRSRAGRCRPNVPVHCFALCVRAPSPETPCLSVGPVTAKLCEMAM